MTTETVEPNVACRSFCDEAKAPKPPMTFPTTPPVEPPPRTSSTPTRGNSTPVPHNSVVFQVFNKDNSSSLIHGFTPRVVPDINSTTHGIVKDSAIRSTINADDRTTTPTRVGPVRHASASSPLTDRSTISREGVLPPPLPSRKPISDLLKIARYMDDQGRNDLNENEKDAALTLLVLKECSRHIFDMSKGWSNLEVVSLCDFVVAQRKCQTMLNNIETLKDMKIQSRDSNNEGQYANSVDRPNGREKNVKFQDYQSSSSSVISIDNVTTPPQIDPPAHREKALPPRSSSMSSERTLTYSPLSSDRSTPTPVSLENSNDNDSNSPCQSDSTPNTKIDNVFVSLSDSDRKHMSKIGKTSKSGKNRNAHMRCLHCSSTETPEWRKGPGGPTTLCNACGLFYKKLIKKFGEALATSVMKSRQVEDPQNRKIPRFARI